MNERGRLLVSGASGFLGAHVVETASRAGWQVIALVHSAPLPLPLPAGARVLAADLSGAHELERIFDSAAPLAVIHTAALSRIADCERDPRLAQIVNVEAAGELARHCAARGARFVHVSTDLVFGAAPAPSAGFDEDSEPAPLSRYGVSKFEAESAVRSSEARALVVRLPLLVGPSHGRGLGASDSIHAALARGEIPALFEDEWRTPLDVRSAAQALIELAGQASSGILHVAGPERISRYELGLRALRQQGLRADRARARIRATTRHMAGLEKVRPADVSLNSARARSFLRTVLVGLDSGAS